MCRSSPRSPRGEPSDVFQRSAQYVVPIANLPESEDTIAEYKANYEAIWKQVKTSAVAFGFTESTTAATSVSQEERERVFERAWKRGGGFRFMFETFSDIATSREANDAAADFIKRKIGQIVKNSRSRAQAHTNRYLCQASTVRQRLL